MDTERRELDDGTIVTENITEDGTHAIRVQEYSRPPWGGFAAVTVVPRGEVPRTVRVGQPGQFTSRYPLSIGDVMIWLRPSELEALQAAVSEKVGAVA